MLEILKSVFMVGSATVFNLLVWVVAGKVMAVTLGPAGVGIYGILRQFAMNLNIVTTFNGSTTLVQGLASRPEHLKGDYARNIALIFIGLAAGSGLILVAKGSWLAPRLLGAQVPVAIMPWMLLPLFGMSLSSFFLGLINGFRHMRALVVCQALGPLAVLALILPATRWIRNGGFWAYAFILGVPYFVIGLSGLWVALRNKWLSGSGSFLRPEPRQFMKDGKAFFRLSTALLIGGFASTALQLFINSLVAQRLGVAESGQFWVAWSLSMTYVTVLLSSFGAYYLPSLSGAQTQEAKQALIQNFTRIAILVMPLLITLVIVLKGEVVRLLFSRDLLPSLRLFRWMLLGDFLKVLSWIWVFPMLAYAEGKRFMILELTTNILWGALAWAAFRFNPRVETMGQVFLVVYFGYAITGLVYLASRHQVRFTFRLFRDLTGGGAVIMFASLLFWDRQHASLPLGAMALAMAIGNLVLSLTPEERRAFLDPVVKRAKRSDAN